MLSFSFLKASLSYDGVYGVPEHRIRGGGGLGLINHVADFLGIGPDIITGRGAINVDPF